MTHDDNDVHDVRELLGLRTIAAKTVVTAYVATFALVAWSTNPPPEVDGSSSQPGSSSVSAQWASSGGFRAIRLRLRPPHT